MGWFKKMTVWTVMSTSIHIAHVNIIKYQWLTSSISTIHYLSNESFIRGFLKSLSKRQRHVLRSFLSGTRRTLRTGFDKKGSHGYLFQLLRDTPGCFIIQLTRTSHCKIFEPSIDYYGHTRRRWKSWHEEDRWGRQPSRGAFGTHGSTHTLDWQ